MGRFTKGDVVVFPFPFTDLTGDKPRPALVVADLPGDDLILCAITKNPNGVDVIPLEGTDFSNGKLRIDPSYIRPSKLFTGLDAKVLGLAAQIEPAKMAEVTTKIIEIVSR